MTIALDNKANRGPTKFSIIPDKGEKTERNRTIIGLIKFPNCISTHSCL